MSEMLPLESWSDEQRAFYGKMMRFLSTNQPLMTHPRAAMIDPAHWETICHNAAVTATDMLVGDIEIVDDDGVMLATSGQVTIE